MSTEKQTTQEPQQDNIFYRLAEQLEIDREHGYSSFASKLEVMALSYYQEQGLKNKAFSFLISKGLYDEFYNAKTILRYESFASPHSFKV